MMGGIDAGWLWLIGGVILLIAEVIAPGFFLVFVGAAAIATGLFTILFGLGLGPQIALFVLYALLAVEIGAAFLCQPARPQHQSPAQRPRRAAHRQGRDRGDRRRRA